VLFPSLWCFPPAVSGWGSVWVGLTPRDDLASTGFHDCHRRTVRQPRPTRPRLATGAHPSVPHHHPIRPRRARTTSRPTSMMIDVVDDFLMMEDAKGRSEDFYRCPVRLSNSRAVSLIQLVLMTLVLRLIMNDGFSFDLSIACPDFFRVSWVNRW